MSYVKGIDVALYEPNIDWVKVRTQEIRFAFIKASQADFNDPKFDSHWAGAKQAGILRGAYHFLDPRVDGNIQAETYLRKAKLEPGDLPPVLDLEELYVKASAIPQNLKGLKSAKASKGSKGAKPVTVPDKVPVVVPNTQMISCTEKWLTKVEAETGRKPIIYSRADFLKEHVSGPGGKPPQWAMNHMIWVANYLDHEIRDNDLPIQPMGWSDWTFWQYSDTGLLDGVTNEDGKTRTGVDLNFYRGTLEELYALAGATMPDVLSGAVLTENAQPKVDAVSAVHSMDVAASTPISTMKHLVKSGDTLGALALQFHTTVEAIMALNPQITNPNIIKVGDTLNIPHI